MDILAWLDGLKWIDGTPLQIEPYRRDLFERAFSRDANGRLRYSMVLSGRAKKNNKTLDLTLAGLYCLTMLESPQGSDVLIVANSEDQAGDDLDLAKKVSRHQPTPCRRPRSPLQRNPPPR
jgi:phage terminase large subunit-like protein